jgi:hypothetical protein
MTRSAIKDLKEARYGPRPRYISRPRHKGLRAMGVAYERKFGKRFLRDYPTALLGQWIYFVDARGAGVAQPDVLLRTEDAVHVVECKLSHKEDAEQKIRKVYGVLLRHLHPGLKIHFTQVFKNFNGFKDPVIDLEQILEGRSDDDYLRCHWIP